MEPLTPAVREKILEEHPLASSDEIDEYERLLAQRFTVDPDDPMSTLESSKRDEDEQRLKFLYKKLFSNP